MLVLHKPDFADKTTGGHHHRQSSQISVRDFADFCFANISVNLQRLLLELSDPAFILQIPWAHLFAPTVQQEAVFLATSALIQG